MALHAIWAGLPIELTSLIIERTEHLQTLQNWCIATAGCSELQAAAYRYRYRDIYLDLTNLCQDPAIERKPRKPQKKNKKSKEHTSPWEEEPGLSDLLLEVDKVTSQLPARYIKNLVLDLQQAPEIARNAWATKYGAPDPQWRYVRKEEGYPYVQDAEYTIRRLFSEANNLHSVEQKGPAADLIVNAILTTAAPSCTSFAFRVGGDKEFPFMKRAPGSGRGHGGLHKWTGLESRKGIKSLTLGDLYWPEAHFLATAVRSLECLEDLKITFMKEKAPYGYTEFFVLCFLDTEDENKKDDLKEPRSISNLPNTLRSISLEGCIDHTLSPRIFSMGSSANIPIQRSQIDDREVSDNQTLQKSQISEPKFRCRQPY